MITIVGAGSIGLSLGGRLARAGERVCVVTRRAEAAEALNARGVTVRDLADDKSFSARVEAVPSPDALPDAARRGTIVLCMRTTELDGGAFDLVRTAPHALFVCAQNDVDNEARVASLADRVAGLVFRQTCTRQDDTRVYTHGAGRIVLGDHPRGCGPRLEPLACAAERAGFSVGRSPAIERDKWLKLCINLMSTPNALVQRADHTTSAFVEVKARLLDEAADVLAAAGIDAHPCDANDRTLAEEAAYQRASLAGGTSARALPVYNAVWRALDDRRLGLEADRFHQRIIDLGTRHAVPTPANARALAALLGARKHGHGPESIGAEELLT